ncbi:hypothetical protein [Salmonella enterica]|nr:hypothetical protein [Salmonella enterica]
MANRDWWASRRTTSVMAMVMDPSGKLNVVAVMVNGGGNHRL